MKALAKPNSRFLRAVSISLILAGLAACSPGKPEAETDEESSTEASSTQDAKEESKGPDYLVRVTASDRANDFATLALVSNISYIEFSVKSCASGYQVAGLGAATQSFKLYKYDQGCKATLDRFTISGEIFTITPGNTFNTAVNANNSFTGTSGKVVQVKVVKQLPTILDAVNSDISFLITENSLGANVTVVVYQVGISVSPSQITEGDSAPATFMVRRASPAVGALTVNLTRSGTAVVPTDIAATPSSIVLPDGQTSATFTVSALTDSVLDDNKTVIMTVGLGAYDASTTPATLTIKDKPPMVAPVWNTTLGNQTVLEGNAVNLTATASTNAGDPVTYGLNTTRTTCTVGWTPSLAINSSGVIYGIPDDPAVGTCLLVITATNSVGTISQDINFTVQNLAEPPTWTTTFATKTLFDAEALDLTFKATDPDAGATIVYSLDASSTCSSASWTTAPAINSSTGRVTGTPSANSVGVCTIVVKATSQGDVITTPLYVTVTKRTLIWDAPAGVALNACVPVSVTLGDNAGRTTTAGTAFTMNLVINNGTGTFHTASNCSNGSAVTTRAWTATTSSVAFYFKGTTSGQNLTLVATGSSFDPGVTNVTVGAAASKLVVAGPATIAVGQCVKYRIDQTDASGNKIATTAAKSLTVTFPSSVSAFTDASCDTSLYSPSIAQYKTGIDVYILGVSTSTSAYLRAVDPAGTLTQMQLNFTVTSTRSWYSSSWGYRTRINVENLDQATAFTNQPVLVRLDASRIDYSKVKSDGSDLRFLASNNSTVLPHQIQQWIPYGTSLVWVKVDAIAASSAQSYFYMYFGNAAATATTTSASVWSDYTYVYHLTESPTATAPQYKDSTTSANHGTAVASPKSSTGPVGNCASFMGSLDYINLTNSLAPVLGGTATFSAWIKTAQVGTTPAWSAPAITGVENNGDGNDIQYGWLDGSGYLGVTAGDGSAAQSSFLVNDNAWRHITVTRQSSNGAVAFFTNGVANGSGTSETGTKSTAFKQIGMLWESTGAHRDFNGYVGEIRIYNGVMTAARIRADYKYQLDNYLTFRETETY